jgi:hypothetical protein
MNSVCESEEQQELMVGLIIDNLEMASRGDDKLGIFGEM